MKIDINFYLSWAEWAMPKFLQLQATNPTLAAAFYQDTIAVTRASLNVWGSLPLHGKGLGLAWSLLQWALANPDPLKEARRLIIKMRVTYGSPK